MTVDTCLVEWTDTGLHIPEMWGAILGKASFSLKIHQTFQVPKMEESSPI